MSVTYSGRPRRPGLRPDAIKIDRDIPLDAGSSVASTNHPTHEEADQVMESLAEEASPLKVARPDQRPAMRPDNSRDLAAKRAAEIMDGLGGTVNEGTDKFYIDPSMVPDGWDYNWKRKSVYGMEDPAYQVSLARTGWETVPTANHPTMMPVGNYPVIERDGMILMMRPKVISERFEAADQKRARDQVRVKEQQLNQNPDGQFGRDHQQVKAKISKGYEAIPIPKD